MAIHRSLTAALALAALALPALAQPSIIKEGEGARRRQLDALQLKPFPVANFDKLSDWTNGEAPTAGTMDGKVVVILCWSDWYPSAARALSLAKRTAEKYASEGVIVVAAHSPEGWKEAKKPKAEGEGQLILAHDAKGEFRAALVQDQDPDFYVIDRAGQMRFADIATESVDAAVEYLVKESKDKASGLNAELSAQARSEDAARRRSDAIRASVDMTALPEVPFSMPTPEEYSKDKVRWPVMPRPENSPPEDPRNPEPPVILTLPETGYFPSKPNLAGRAVVVYFWHPDWPASFRLFEPMDTLQRQHPRDVVVIGVMSPIKISGGGSQQDYKLDDDPATLQKKITDMLRTQRLSHHMLLDVSGSIFETVKGKESEVPLPFGAVVSSDNAVRGWGMLFSSRVRGALDRVLAVDPGIKARREAEDQYLRSKK